MTIRVAINGFGRIGRNVLRAHYESGKKHDVEIVAVNTLGSDEINAHLLRYDTVHGRFNGEVSTDGPEWLIVNGDRIRMFSTRDPREIPWGEYGVDVVLECTGAFTSKEKALVHLEQGAKKVLISAPGKNADATVVYGVNDDRGESAVMKLMGSLCVLFAGGSVWWLQHQEQRRRRQVLAELAAALDYMETSIRLNRTPLLPLFRQAARGRCHEVSQLFERSVAALAAGRSPEIVWCQAVSCLPVSETDKRALSELVNALQGDEASACKGILLARKELQNSLSQLEKQRPEEEKRTAALCFSAAALLVILLI